MNKIVNLGNNILNFPIENRILLNYKKKEFDLIISTQNLINEPQLYLNIPFENMNINLSVLDKTKGISNENPIKILINPKISKLILPFQESNFNIKFSFLQPYFGELNHKSNGKFLGFFYDTDLFISTKLEKIHLNYEIYRKYEEFKYGFSFCTINLKNIDNLFINSFFIKNQFFNLNFKNEFSSNLTQTFNFNYNNKPLYISTSFSVENNLLKSFYIGFRQLIGLNKFFINTDIRNKSIETLLRTKKKFNFGLIKTLIGFKAQKNDNLYLNLGLLFKTLNFEIKSNYLSKNLNFYLNYKNNFDISFSIPNLNYNFNYYFKN